MNERLNRFISHRRDIRNATLHFNVGVSPLHSEYVGNMDIP